VADPDEVVVAKPAALPALPSAFADADQTLEARYEQDRTCRRCARLVTRVERYAGAPLLRCCPPRWRRCRRAGAGTPFSPNIVALAMYLRFVHAVSYQRLSRLMLRPVRTGGSAKARWMPRSAVASHSSTPIVAAILSLPAPCAGDLLR